VPPMSREGGHSASPRYECIRRQWERIRLPQFLSDDEREAATATVPLGRLGTPDDLGKAALFLASGDSTYVTGIELYVDGGVAQI
jgi:NAD(P)-dependent dehydrogenase (short-subunit alcohol dehydrogenase family)